MHHSSRALRHRLKLWILPGLVLLAGLSLIYTLTAAVERAERQRIRLETEVTTSQVALRLEAWLDDRLAISHHLARHDFMSSDHATRTFTGLASQFIDLHSGFQALNYVDPAGVIQVVTPLEPNRDALGMSLMNHPDARVAAALQAARESDEPHSTPVIQLYQGGLGIATYQAIRGPGGRLLGLVNCVFRLATLVNTCLAEQELRDSFRFVLLDEAGDEAYRHAPASAADLPDRWAFATSRPLRVVDRSWALVLAPRFDHLVAARTLADEILSGLGYLLVTMMAVLTHLLARRQEALAESQAKYRLLVEHQSDLVVQSDPDQRLLYVSPSYCEFFGEDEGTLLGRDFMPFVHEDDRETTSEALRQVRQPPYQATHEQRVHTSRGWRWLHWSANALRDDRGQVTSILGIGRDITERRELEDQLRQSQKMQAIGQLAGGIAHDFNNLLQAMLGHLELLEQDLAGASERVMRDVDAIKRSALRAAKLTRQLLAFSRRQPRAVDVHDLGTVVSELEHLLKRLLPEGIALVVETGRTPIHVHADRDQFEQVIINLCVNARDAILATGRINITVGRTEDHALLTVNDDGQGMTTEVQERIFEPFFTTKAVGQGTGLGLSTVFGIVEQHDGSIEVKSAPGKGSTFAVTLPLCADQQPRADTRPTVAPGGGRETILIAEDEDLVRELSVRVLTAAGYRVVTASDGIKAITAFAADPSIELVMLDIGMPRMDGLDAAQEIRRRRPGIPLIFVSGHDVGTGARDLGEPILTKPFSSGTALELIREVLDAARETN